MRSISKTVVALGCMAGAAFATIDDGDYTTHFDADINLSNGTYFTWYADEPHLLCEPVYVDSGCTLEIKAGTWIYGGPGTYASAGGGDIASALVVARGGTIIAEGTVDSPIVFTGKGDDPNDPYDVGPGAKGMWGGVILLGHAQINNPYLSGTYAGMHVIEGLDDSDPRSYYGNPNNTYNSESSGTLKYVSIRHGGACKISNEEINGLTMGGVGSGTTLEYIEVFSNSDDGFEWFGGTAKAKYLVSAFVQDDGFDYDEGWCGKGQFWFSLNQEYEGDKGGEHDGMASGYLDSIWSEPSIYNVTYIGSGNPNSNSKNSACLHFRDSAGGHYNNVLITQFDNYAILSDDDALPWGESTPRRSMNGCIIWDVNDNDPANIIYPASDWTNYLSATARKVNIVDPQLKGVSRDMNQPFLDPRPCDTSVAYDTNYAVKPPWDGWLVTANAKYVGAFRKSSDLWIRGWTALDEMDVVARRLYIHQRGPIGNHVLQLQFHASEKFFPDGAHMWFDDVDTSSLLTTLWPKRDTCGYSFFNSMVFGGSNFTAKLGDKGDVRKVKVELYNSTDTITDSTVWFFK